LASVANAPSNLMSLLAIRTLSPSTMSNNRLRTFKLSTCERWRRMRRHRRARKPAASRAMPHSSYLIMGRFVSRGAEPHRLGRRVCSRLAHRLGR